MSSTKTSPWRLRKPPAPLSPNVQGYHQPSTNLSLDVWRPLPPVIGCMRRTPFSHDTEHRSFCVAQTDWVNSCSAPVHFIDAFSNLAVYGGSVLDPEFQLGASIVCLLELPRKHAVFWCKNLEYSPVQCL